MRTHSQPRRTPLLAPVKSPRRVNPLLLTAATSSKHRGPQCLLTLTRSTSPPPRSVSCACVLVSPLNMNRLWTKL